MCTNQPGADVPPAVLSSVLAVAGRPTLLPCYLTHGRRVVGTVGVFCSGSLCVVAKLVSAGAQQHTAR